MKNSIVYFIDDLHSPFVINDIKILSKRTHVIYLFISKQNLQKVKLPANVVVIDDYLNWSKFEPFRILLNNFISILLVYFNETWATKKVLPFKRSIALIASNIFKAESILNCVQSNSISLKKTPFYAFWFYDCIYLAWLKKKGLISKAICRTHSGDLYEYHISIKNKILFRNFQFKYLDAVLPVSKMGTEYLSKKYPESQAIIKTVFLGTEDQGINPYAKECFTIVSCASLRHHKRIHKIAKMLLYVDIPVHWIHFGDERLTSPDPKIHEYIKYKDLLIQKKNVKYTPMGYILNEDIFKFYQNNPVNLFISLSAYEGIPVSIMEAISFGIPVLSTDVGGCSEIVNEQTGKLIPLTTPSVEVAKIVEDIANSEINTTIFRKGVRSFWKENFEIENNYQTLFKILES